MFRQHGEHGQYLVVDKERGCWVIVDGLYNESISNNVISFSSFIAESMCPTNKLNLKNYFSTSCKWNQKMWTDQRLKLKLFCSSHN